MLKTITMIAAVLAMAVSFFPGLLLTPLLNRFQRLRAAVSEPELSARNPDEKRAPLLGGVLLWAGTVFAAISAWMLGAQQLSGNGYHGGWRMIMTLLSAAVAFGIVGLIDDCLRIGQAGALQPGQAARGLHPALRLVLQALAGGVFLLQEQLNGGLSTALNLPGHIHIELGLWYYPLALLLILLVVRSADTAREADGLCAGTGFVASLTFLVAAMLLLDLENPGDRFVTALFAASAAGSCVGFLFWNFHPARLRCGSAGAMFIGGAAAAMAWGLERPEMLLAVCLPWFWNGFGAALHAITRGRLFPGGAQHRVLAAKGWSSQAITALACGIGCLGSLLAILSLFIHG